MYLILAAQFESWMQPIAILMALPVTIPFGMLSLVLFHTPMDLYAMFGLFMLVGIVKKNGILQVDATNQLRAKGESRHDAIIDGQPHPAAADPDDHRDAGRGHGADRAGQRPRRRCSGQHGQSDHRRPDAFARAGLAGHAGLLCHCSTVSSTFTRRIGIRFSVEPPRPHLPEPHLNPQHAVENHDEPAASYA